ncbi:hypothetical protein [Nannocystis pusilla]|uniref:hypothetical protein n=1 Tax=Nannocystis pusilla TaxID=889268 RepID=UPI003B7E8FA3
MTPETIRRMAGGALAVSAFSIALALVAYWRAGGKQEAETAHAEIRATVDSLREKQTELVEHTRGSLDAAFQNSRDRLTRVRELLRIEKDRAEAELKHQLDRAEGDVNRLVASVELEARKIRDSTIGSAEQAERALSQRVRTIEGRVALLRAKYKARRAEVLADGQEYEEALRALVEATDLLDQAQERLPASTTRRWARCGWRCTRRWLPCRAGRSTSASASTRCCARRIRWCARSRTTRRRRPARWRRVIQRRERGAAGSAGGLRRLPVRDVLGDRSSRRGRRRCEMSSGTVSPVRPASL